VFDGGKMAAAPPAKVTHAGRAAAPLKCLP
jgi:hypothetical protein